MTRHRYAVRQAIACGFTSAVLGLTTGNPNWLKLNPILGLVLGYLVGLAIWPLIRRSTGAAL